MRSMGSARADPNLTTSAAAAALSGPLHGGANEEVLKMLDEIGSKDNVPAYVKKIAPPRQIYAGHDLREFLPIKNFAPVAAGQT